MKQLWIVIAVCLAVGACVGNRYDNDTYDPRGVGVLGGAARGVVINARQMVIRGATQDGANVGAAVGGTAAGVAAARAGAGVAGIVGGVVGGAVVGAVAGAAIEASAGQGVGMEYVVQIDSGQLLTVSGGNDVVFSVGQRVIVLQGRPRSRLIADTTR